jgi:hypothetical protein
MGPGIMFLSGGLILACRVGNGPLEERRGCSSSHLPGCCRGAMRSFHQGISNWLHISSLDCLDTIVAIRVLQLSICCGLLPLCLRDWASTGEQLAYLIVLFSRAHRGVGNGISHLG